MNKRYLQAKQRIANKKQAPPKIKPITIQPVILKPAVLKELVSQYGKKGDRFSRNQIKIILTLIYHGFTQVQICKMFKIKPTTFNDLRHFRTYQAYTRKFFKDYSFMLDIPK